MKRISQVNLFVLTSKAELYVFHFILKMASVNRMLTIVCFPFRMCSLEMHKILKASLHWQSFLHCYREKKYSGTNISVLASAPLTINKKTVIYLLFTKEAKGSRGLLLSPIFSQLKLRQCKCNLREATAKPRLYF
jgi:hypothetical protein